MSGRANHESGRVMTAIETGVIFKIMLGLLFSIAVVAIMCFGKVIYREEASFFEGQPAHVDVIVDFDFEYVDKEKTDEVKQRAAAAVFPVFRFDAKRFEEGKKELGELFALMDEVSRDRELPTAGMVDRIKEGSTVELTGEEVAALLRIRNRERLQQSIVAVLDTLKSTPALRSAEREVVGEAITVIDPDGDERVVEATLLVEEDGLPQLIETLVKAEVSGAGQDISLDAVRSIAGPNLIFDPKETELRRFTAREAVAMPPTQVKKGKKIIERGNEVTAKDLYILKAYQEEMRKRFSQMFEEKWMYITGVALLVLSLLVGMSIYLRRFQPGIYGLNSRLLLLGLLLAGAVLMSKIIILIPLWRITSDWKHMLYYLSSISIPVAAILVGLLLDRKLALFVIIVLSLITGIMKGFDLSFLIVGIVGGMMASYSIADVRRRSQIVKSGLVIGLTYFVTILAVCMMTGLHPGRQMNYQLGGGVVTGLLSAFMAMALLPVLESIFNITTDISLVELSDLNHPLLKKMVFAAPGTYHHSLMVANLAEAAAEAVGANALQARVASYFHDIGKLSKPEYFSENERNNGSKHDSLDPGTSTLIIMSHVKDGIGLARKHKLGKLINNGIREHHGTSLVYYFYVKAETAGNGAAPVKEEDFRYPGPRPRSKETGIILLADAVEATSRSLSDISPESIEKMTLDIINDRLMDGQLDECELTLRDLRLIGERFAFTLNGTFHSRVKYPNKDHGDEGAGTGTQRPEKS